LDEETDSNLIGDHGDLANPGDDKDGSEDKEGDEDNEELMESTATVQVALDKVCLHYNPFLLFPMTYMVTPYRFVNFLLL
jgi:hypothetical protein